MQQLLFLLIPDAPGLPVTALTSKCSRHLRNRMPVAVLLQSANFPPDRRAVDPATQAGACPHSPFAQSPGAMGVLAGTVGPTHRAVFVRQPGSDNSSRLYKVRSCTRADCERAPMIRSAPRGLFADRNATVQRYALHPISLNEFPVHSNPRRFEPLLSHFPSQKIQTIINPP